jgi:hypothetical protein
MRKKHIMLQHWHWLECEYCQEPVDPDKYDHHKIRKHKVKTQCKFCDKKFPSRNTSEYKKHIAYCKAENFTCDCSIVFENKKHKAHHMQSVHLKASKKIVYQS